MVLVHFFHGADQKLSAQALVCGDAQIQKSDTYHTLQMAQKAFTYLTVPRSTVILFYFEQGEFASARKCDKRFAQASNTNWSE